MDEGEYSCESSAIEQGIDRASTVYGFESPTQSLLPSILPL